MELKDRSLTRYTAVVGGALGLSLVVYLVVGVSGYLSFGDAVSGDVLENFADDFNHQFQPGLMLVLGELARTFELGYVQAIIIAIHDQWNAGNIPIIQSIARYAASRPASEMPGPFQ